MCGILAVVDLKGRPLDERHMRRLRDVMVHRGPDDEGLIVEGPVALGHRRLSIIDLSTSGHQPMGNEDGSVQVVFNGEIYNYLELREDLLRRGHRFHSSSDTEVIVHQYDEDAERCVEKLRGMFGFVIWDRRRQRLVAARDRIGIKPVYYYHDAKRFVLASEMKVIVEDDAVPRRADMRALADYMFAGHALAGKTVFEGIHELEPGHLLTLDLRTGSLAVKKYWDLRYDYNRTRSDEQTNEEFFAVLDEAVAVQCRSDAPLGSHLSDGIDSSVVSAFASRHRDHIDTFTIKFSDDPHVDGARYTRTVARYVGAEYHEASPTADDLADLLPFLIWHIDTPMISDGAFGYLTVAEFARKHVKVTLTGHGGDEICAGYPAQFQAAFNTRAMFDLHRDPDRIPPKQSLLQRVVRKGPRGLWRALRHRAVARPGGALEDLWVALHCSGSLQENRFIDPSWLNTLGGYSPRDAYIAPIRQANTDETLDKCLYHDLRVYLPSLLHKEDRMSMAVSLESRVPLLDERVVEFLATVPPEQKVRGLQPKHMLRKAAAKLLPDDILQSREKRGFPVPGSFWRSPRVNETVRQILLSKESMGRGLFTARGLREACENVTLYWPLLNVELWFRIFIDRDPYWTQRARERRGAVAQH
jgi:asparagine synthase (glutamine-hydrolysing)